MSISSPAESKHSKCCDPLTGLNDSRTELFGRFLFLDLPCLVCNVSIIACIDTDASADRSRKVSDLPYLLARKLDFFIECLCLRFCNTSDTDVRGAACSRFA